MFTPQAAPPAASQGLAGFLANDVPWREEASRGFDLCCPASSDASVYIIEYIYMEQKHDLCRPSSLNGTEMGGRTQGREAQDAGQGAKSIVV